jgi:hypothetical protein
MISSFFRMFSKLGLPGRTDGACLSKAWYPIANELNESELSDDVNRKCLLFISVQFKDPVKG